MHPFSRIFKISMYTLSALATFTLGFMIQGRDTGPTSHARLDTQGGTLGSTLTFGTPVAFADVPTSDDSSCGTCASCSSCTDGNGGSGDSCDSDGGDDCGK
ncbi:MAG: hypothetical protein KBE09_03330 [Candidatus Pacebacteria bacterium]|nr:hypothetical protein [Candidatus Paceibacterota bacterium]